MRPIKVISKGASGPLDTQTVTVGRKGNPVFNNQRSGFSTFAPTLGSVLDGTSNIYGGASIIQIDSEDDGTGSFDTTLVIGGNRANSGWTSLTINGTILLRANASYNFDGTNTNWGWLRTGDIWPLTGSMTPVVFN